MSGVVLVTFRAMWVTAVAISMISAPLAAGIGG